MAHAHVWVIEELLDSDFLEERIDSMSSSSHLEVLISVETEPIFSLTFSGLLYLWIVNEKAVWFNNWLRKSVRFVNRVIDTSDAVVKRNLAEWVANLVVLVELKELLELLLKFTVLNFCGVHGAFYFV